MKRPSSLATLNDRTAGKKRPDLSAEAKAAAELVRAAKDQGLSLTGPAGLLKQLTKTVLEAALNEEMTDRLGCAEHEPDGAGRHLQLPGQEHHRVVVQLAAAAREPAMPGELQPRREQQPRRAMPTHDEVHLVRQ